jgi:cell division protein FtsN
MKKSLSLIIIFLFILIVILIFVQHEKAIPLMGIPQAVAPQTNPKKPDIQKTSLKDSLETDVGNKVKAGYYIIVGSFRNLTQAQQKAGKLITGFKTDIIVLSPTTEGYYRISCGKYSTLEEASARIKDVRANIDSAAWILSVKE